MYRSGYAWINIVYNKMTVLTLSVWGVRHKKTLWVPGKCCELTAFMLVSH